MYLNKDSVISALNQMVNFENQLNSLYGEFELSLRENTGRRNMLLSQAQEQFFTNELVSEGYNAICSGKTGEPDIVLLCKKKEIECKLTSASNSSWPLQCDYSTLKRKGSLDFLYVLSDRDFSKFAVLLFEGLSVGDFHLPAPGSRQKSRMNKKSAMKKCNVLYGSIEDTGDKFRKRYITELERLSATMILRSDELQRRIASGSTNLKIQKAKTILENEKKSFTKKRSELLKKIKYWSDNGSRYEISLETL